MSMAEDTAPRRPGRPSNAEIAARQVEVDTPNEESTGARVTRQTRKPFGSQSQKLAYPERAGYHRHWFNDMPGRILQAQDAGYAHVSDPATGKNVSRVVGVAPNGEPLTGFLMEIPLEWYQDDMAAQAKMVADREDTILKGQVNLPNGPDNQSHFRPEAQGRRIQVQRR